MKKLGVSLVAILVGLPMMAQAAVQSPADVTVDTTKHVAATSFVQGAYNALAGVARDHATQIDANTTAIAGKQAQLTNGTNNVGATVGTSVRATGTADDITLVTEKAVRDAIDNAGGQTAQQVKDAIDAAAGAGIATDGNGKLSVDLTSNGGLELTGSGDAATVGVKVDGTHVIKDASGNVTLSSTDIANLTAASTALQASNLDNVTIEKDATNGVQVKAGSIGTTQLASGVVTSLGLADSALQKTDIKTGGANGTIAVDGTDVAVKGLGTAAYTASTDYATAAQGAKADQAATDIGTMANLTTTATNLVGAINEVKGTAGFAGAASELTDTHFQTADKTSAAKAANAAMAAAAAAQADADALETTVGNAALSTTAQTVTGAINELKTATDSATNKQVEVYTTWNTTTTGKAAALVNPD